MQHTWAGYSSPLGRLWMLPVLPAVHSWVTDMLLPATLKNIPTSLLLGSGERPESSETQARNWIFQGSVALPLRELVLAQPWGPLHLTLLQLCTEGLKSQTSRGRCLISWNVGLRRLERQSHCPSHDPSSTGGNPFYCLWHLAGIVRRLQGHWDRAL